MVGHREGRQASPRQGYCPTRCSDPLFIRDEQARTYVPYSVEALTRAGLTPFAVADHG